MALLVLIAIVVVVAIYVVGIFNKLVRLRNQFKNAFAQIDVQLKRRYDLIPNLVETAKAYLKHERDTLESVIAARNKAHEASKTAAADPASNNAMKGLIQADNQLTTTMGRLLAVFENYPDLKANQTIAQLMEELSSTENKIAFARQHFNDSVMDYNTNIEVFPNSLVATKMNFTHAELFVIDNPAEKQAVKVNL